MDRSRLGMTVGLVALSLTLGCSGAIQTRSDGGPADDGGLPADAAPDDAGGGDGAPAADGGDEYGPWAGGAAYYDGFGHGPPTSADFFPISVWLQSPSSAAAYAAIGVNQFVGLWEGPTEAQLTDLTAAGMPALADQNAVGLAHAGDAVLRGWTQQDEPDNAQPDGNGGYGPCVAPADVVARYDAVRAADPTRPVFLNFGQGVANDAWVGRGSCSDQPEDYPAYAAGADIVSFDIYPMNNTDASHGQLWLEALGVDRLQEAVGRAKPVWTWIECTQIDPSGTMPTPAQVKAEVWMAIVHGAMGIGYFAHRMDPFDEHALLDEPEMKDAVAAINARIAALAPVLNTPPIVNAVTVASSAAAVPVDVLVKRHGGALYVFAVAMRDGATHVTFTVRGGGAATVEVLDEARTVPLADGVFADDFDGFAVHLYRIPG